MTENRKVFLTLAGIVVINFAWNHLSKNAARKAIDESRRQSDVEYAEFREFLNTPEGAEIKSRIQRLQGEEFQKRWEEREFLEWRETKRKATISAAE